MANGAREVWITGLGLLSCLGEGAEAHRQRCNEAKPAPDVKTFAPYIVHPLAPVNFDKQIPKKGDQRQMEPWQRIGTYAAGLALDDAGVKGNAEILGRMDMIVAAGGGERDFAADSAILSGLRKAEQRERYLNERLMSDIRPTLFLAQLSNLLAGNISIVHGVTGSSRTFMGEEAAGCDAVRVALARIEAGQSEITLVGGAFNGERKDVLMLYEFAGLNLKHEFRTVWDRAPAGGFAIASIGAFLVLESNDHARARGALPIARLSQVHSLRSNRSQGAATAALQRMWMQMTETSRIETGHAAIISGASGAEPATKEERAFLEQQSDLPIRATGSLIGHGIESQFAMNVALAAIAVKHGRLYPPCDPTGFERPMDAILRQAIVTGVGHWRGEGLALVEAVG